MRKPLSTVLTAALGALATTVALAQQPLTEAEVKKVDLGAAKVTLKHGAIKSLDMPPITMAYLVKDPAVLAGLKVGDHVRFAAERAAAGYTVTALQIVR